MHTRTLILVGCLLLLTQSFSLAETAPATSPVQPPEPIAAALAAPVVAPEVVLEEVRRFAEARIVKMPKVQTAEQWQQIARQLRSDMLEKVVLRGEAVRWNSTEAKVEWFDALPTTCPADKNAGYSVRKLRFEALPGLWIPALLYVPDKLEGLVPVGLAINGHELMGKALVHKQTRCINQAKRGMIVLNVDWFYMGQLRKDGFYHYRANQLDLCGTSAVSPFYLSMKRSLDILLSQPHADPQRVAVSGLSGGGWQTIFISGLDERVMLANPVAGYSSYFTRARYPSDMGDTEQAPCDMATVADYIHLTAMRAPQPTLLTFNSKDDCCFASDHALQPLLDAARLIFALYGHEANLRSHINDVPGTHNFEQDNREAFYKMIGDHFFAGQKYDWHEIPCRDEVKTAEQLAVPLPANNEDFNTLARKLMANLPRNLDKNVSAPIASDGAAARDKLREIVHFKSYDVKAEGKPVAAQDGMQITQFQLKLGNDWSVPATQFAKASPAGTILVIADKGRKTMADDVRRLLGDNQRVIAVDPFYFGSSTIISRGSLHALQVAAVGERPLGIQAGQIASIARWAKSSYAGPVTVMAIGPRTSTIALVAAALEQGAIDSLDLHEPLASLKLIIERNLDVEKMPELFCFGLLEFFDIKDIASLVAPRHIHGLHE